MKYLTGLSIACLLLLGVTGCAPDPQSVADETELAAYQRGQRLALENRPGEALAAYLNVIDLRPRSAPESHLEAGRLYLEELGDPVAAVYHFRRCLEQQADERKAELIEQLILTAHKEFARGLPGGPLQSDVQRLDLLDMLEAQRGENQSLKEALAEARATIRQLQEQLEAVRAVPAPSREPVVQATPVAPVESPEVNLGSPPGSSPGQSREYTVQSGDSLYSISRKFYGVTSRYMDIYQANRDTLPSPHALRVGQTLRIPE